MENTIVTGGECGDEAKGKVICLVGKDCDEAIKSIGSHNAGNQVMKGGIKTKFSVIPAAAIWPHVQAVLGPGMQLNPKALLDEIEHVSTNSGEPIIPRLHIAPEAHFLSRAHMALDRKMEEDRGQNGGEKVGTTLKGVGPAVMGKSARLNMRMEDLRQTRDALKDRYGKFLSDMERTFGITLDSKTRDMDLEELLLAKEQLEGRVLPNTVDYWMEQTHGRVLIAGSQGYELAIDGPGYPYVTSNPVNAHGHIAASGGLSAADVTEHYACVKAYSTRVGGGPRWTPMPPDIAAHVQKKGNEFGTQTGRPRDAFWASIIRLRRMLHAERLNKEYPPQLALMKLDVLDELDEILVETDKHPVSGDPIYTPLRGWQESTSGLTDYEALPPNARAYVEFFAKKLNTPISIIGTGPEHEAVIDRR